MNQNETARFQAGETYESVDWFTGGTGYYTVVRRNGDILELTEAHDEIDGFHTNPETSTYEVHEEDGTEYIVFYSYRGNENRLYARR